MGFAPTPFNLVLILAVLVCVPGAYFAWANRNRPGGRPLTAVFAMAALWGASALTSQVVSGFATSLFFEKFLYTGITMTVLSWFVFVLEYTGRGHLVTERSLTALSVEPVVMLLLVWTNDWHRLIWEHTVPSAAEPTGVATGAHGAFFWVHTVYSYALLMVGAALLVRMVYRSQRLYRGQVFAMFVALLGPIGGNLLYVAGLTRVDPTPAGFALSAVACFYAVYRFDFLNLTPIARNTVVDNIRDGVFVLDDRDRVVDVNPMAKRILGVPGDERVVGKHASEMLSVYPGFYERYRDVSQVQEEIGLDDGDRRRYFHIQVSPLFDRRDSPVGRLFLIHDITDQKRRQQELKRQNQRLDQFASLVSHDLRNPLNVADGYVDLAMKTDNTEYLTKVKQSHDRMGHLIEDVLTLAKQGSTITETEPVAIAEVATEAWRNVDTGDAVLQVDADATVEASEGRLLRVFENLFRNSVEHGSTSNRPGAGDAVEHGSTSSRNSQSSGDSLEHGSTGDSPGTAPRVRIRVGLVGGPDDAVASPDRQGFFVEDDGPGIPESIRDQVLEDGFTTADDGTGLGLSIVRSVVDAHGWSVRVTDADPDWDDDGARFEVTGVDLVEDAAKPGGGRTARADGGE